MTKVDVSLVLTCFNESEHFNSSVANIYKVLVGSKLNFEIIFIDDKSLDNTAALIRNFVAKHKNKSTVRARYHQVNQGRGSAVSEGIKLARGKYVGFMDIDCEVSPSYIPDFIRALKNGAEMVCGERHYDVSWSGLGRTAASKLYSQLVKWMLNSPIYDTEAGYKFFNRNKILPVLSLVKDKGWFWDTEIVILGHLKGLQIEILPVRFNRRSDKTSTVHLFSDTLLYLKKLIAFRKRLDQIKGNHYGNS